MNGSAWQVLRDLEAWQITQIPRRPHARQDFPAGQNQHDQQQLRGVAYGTRPGSAIEHAVGTRISDPDWNQRLTDVLAAVRDCRWPLDHLRPASGT